QALLERVEPADGILEIRLQQAEDLLEGRTEAEQLDPGRHLAPLDLLGEAYLLLGREEVMCGHVSVVPVQSVGQSTVRVEARYGHEGLEGWRLRRSDEPRCTPGAKGLHLGSPGM